MTLSPDETAVVEIVDTPEEAASLALPPLLVREPVERFLDEHGLGRGPITATRLGEGHSNVTYCVRRAGTQVVLRRPPRPPLPPSAHDMMREARVLRGLEDSDVPVPRVLATCPDESLLGVPFYVMEYLDGCVLTRATPPGLAAVSQRAAIAERMVTALAALHAVDFEACGLGDFGKPTGYLERQLRRFGALWEAGRTRELPEFDELTAWLRDNLPGERSDDDRARRLPDRQPDRLPRRARCGSSVSSIGRWRRWAIRSQTSDTSQPTWRRGASRATSSRSCSR